jgi:hypothetical protein
MRLLQATRSHFPPGCAYSLCFGSFVVPLRADRPANAPSTVRTKSVDTDTVSTNVATILTPEAARHASLTLCRWALAIVMGRRKTPRQA